MDPARFDHVILWHVFPLGFTGAGDSREQGEPVQHRLPALEPWLDYLVQLGANGLQLGPVFSSQTHGYDTTDYFTIDPRLGEEADLRRLIEQAHARGIKVVLDGVFNHVGRGFERFRAAEAGDAAAAKWFRQEGGNWYFFEGHDSLVVFDHNNPEVRDFVVSVMRHWLDLGIDGWRLDAAYAAPTSFWRAVSGAIRESHPHAWLLGEVIHGDYATFVAESGLDSVTQYELWKASWSSLNDVNLWELDHALGRHRDMLAKFVPTIFVGNHDTTRIASQLSDERHLAHALTVLFTVGGIPAIYAGDEQAFRGIKEERIGGDDEVRPAFPARPEELSRLGEPVRELHQRLIGLRRRKPWMVRGNFERVHVEHEVMIFRVSDPTGDDAVTVCLNLADTALKHDLPDGEEILEGGLGPHEAAVIGRP